MTNSAQVDRLDGRERPGNALVAVVCLVVLGLLSLLPLIFVVVGQSISAPTDRDNQMRIYAATWVLLAVLLFVCAWRLYWGRSGSGVFAIMLAVPVSLLMLIALFPVLNLPFFPLSTLALGAAVLLTAMIWTKPVRKFLGSF